MRFKVQQQFYNQILMFFLLCIVVLENKINDSGEHCEF